ncbi:hypothetical protein AMAG_10846 [Allomyces macrogynus ATCC 38327]|uniref:Ras-GAP domain-containing protein n=1 Tax=Allomyces macrogynus (strain ATCC 38327) TaxID=578462 RepID=A0A0L0SS54_ALLM3|nr:hypothetical protein AMAG_10846 [Allomyces macrogynus ATCC 38327]|eukprot:KNE65194.1 hypothetical protein AMAG_10846 [Allomyces macrogynus ATCC 38327]
MSTPNLFAAANRRGSASDASTRRPSYLALDSIRNNNNNNNNSETSSHYRHASKSASMSEPRRGSLHDRLSDLLRRPSAPGSTVASAKQFQGSSSSYDSREVLRYEIGQLLLAHRQRLLEIVITANFTREHVTDICNSTLALLRAEKAPRATEDFVARVMEKKIHRHAAVEMTDVHLKNALRDNSLEILLLSAFIRTEAGEFLQALLSHFIAENDAALIDLGEDTSRGIQMDVPPSSTPDSPTTPAADTQVILRALVSKLLDRVHSAADTFPPSVLRLCVSLKNQMDDLEAKLSPNPLARSSRCSSTGSTESVPAVPSPLHHAVSTESAPAVPSPLHHGVSSTPVVDNGVGTPLPFPTAELAATESLRALAMDTLRARSAIASPRPGGSVGLPTCASHGSTLPMAHLHSHSHSHGPSHASSHVSSHASSQASLTRQPTLKRTHARRKLRGMVELTVAENIVASCLFLRFLVPVLTMPEQYGVTIPAQGRRALLRGLLQCGRLVNTLCNDSDAKLAGGDIQAQHYIFEQRLKVKQTIERVTSLPVSTDASSANDWHRAILSNGLSSSPPPDDGTPSAASSRSVSADSVATDSPSPLRAAIDPPDHPNDTDAKRSLGKSFMSMLGRSRLQRKKEFRSMPQIHLSGSKDDETAFSSGPLRAPSTSSSPTGGMSLNSLSDPTATAAGRWGVGPSDALMAQMSKGMDRIEEHFHQSAGTFGALHHSLALALLTLKSTLDKFHALPSAGTASHDDHTTSPSAKTLGSKPSAGLLRAFGQRLRFRGSKSGGAGESVDSAQHVIEDDEAATTPRNVAEGTPRLTGLAPSTPASCPVLPSIPTVLSAEPVVLAEQQHRARGLAQ